MKNTINKIAIKIKKLNSITEQISLNKNISQLDVDLLKDEVRDIYSSLLGVNFSSEIEHNDEQIEELEEIEIIKEIIVETAIEEIKEIEEVEEEIKDIEKQIDTSVEVTENTQITNNTKEEISEENAENLDFETKIDITEPLQAPVVQDDNFKRISKPNPETSIADIAESNQQPLINDMILQNSPNDIAHKHLSKPIDNIKSAISIGDQFLYIKEVFNNNNKLYQSTIAELNNKSSFRDAVTHLQKVTDCNLENETTQKFIEIVKRKFL